MLKGDMNCRNLRKTLRRDCLRYWYFCRGLLTLGCVWFCLYRCHRYWIALFSCCFLPVLHGHHFYSFPILLPTWVLGLLFVFFCLLLFCFLGLHLWHVEVPRPGVQSELQLPAYTPATATSDPSHVCDPRDSSWQCQIHNPLSKARYRTCNLKVPIRIRFRCAWRELLELFNQYKLIRGHMRNSGCYTEGSRTSNRFPCLFAQLQALQ